MFIIDTRCLSEPFPTGVTEVARQFISHLTKWHPDAATIAADRFISNTAINALLATGALTIEQLLRIPQAERSVLFLPNINFVNTRPNTKRIQIVHDLSFFHTPAWYPPRMRLWHHATRAVAQLEQATALIAVSEWTKAGLVRFLHIPEARVRVIPPYTPEPLEGEAPALPFSNEPFFLFLGTLEKRKNVRGVVEAFARASNSPELRGHHLMLAGKTGYGAPDVRHLPARVHHMPYVAPHHKWWLMRHATALVYPSFFEGFGIPPLEAASVGCPTIVSDCTAPPETMGDASLCVSPYDLSQLALAMQAIAADSILRDQLKAAGLRRAAWYSKERQRNALRQLLGDFGL